MQTNFHFFGLAAIISPHQNSQRNSFAINAEIGQEIQVRKLYARITLYLTISSSK